MTDDDRVVPMPRKPRVAKGCPICGAPAAETSRPFCSARCAEVDLGRWLKGSYRIPTDEAPSDGEGRPDEEG